MMPSEDRLWRSFRWTGYAVPALCVLAAAMSFTRFLDAEGPSLTAPTRLDWNALLSSLLLLLVGVVWGVFVHRRAKQAERRQRLRARAMAGDDRAMPLAAIEPQEARAGEVMDEPLALLWRPPRSWWIVALVMVVMMGALGLLIGGTTGTSRSNPSPWVALGSTGVACALFAGCMGAFVAYWRKGPSGVVVMETGLRRMQAGKERAFIPWSEARLFEVCGVDANTSQPARGFAVMSERALIEWVVYPPGKAAPADDGASDEEMRRRGQALAQTVIVRTGLAPRTCQPELAFREDADSGAAPR
jgi:hypothetical protein